MTADVQKISPYCGWSGFVIGAIAFVLAVAILWSGPFAPQQSAGVSLGELAVEIGKSAIRKSSGMAQPAPEPVVRNIDDYLKIGIGVLGAAALILGALGLIRHEPKRPAIAAISFGGGTILLQLFVMAIFAIAGAIVIGLTMISLQSVFGDAIGG